VPQLSDFPPWFTVTLATSLGLVFGSFLNVVIHRWPREMNLAFPPSSCPSCGARIRARDNIPVFGWLLLRGKARCCGAPISARYVLVEIIGGLSAWAVLERIVLDLPPSTPWWIAVASFLAHLALVLGLVAAIFIDLEFMLLPDEITIGGTLLAFATVPIRPLDWSSAFIGALVGFLVVWLPLDRLYRLIRGVPGMGLGDAKLLMLAGAWLGWPGALFTLSAGAVQGTVVALVIYFVRGKIDEPEEVRREREQARREIEGLEGEERRRAEVELALDPLADEPGSGLGKARLAFGPFLAVGAIEYLFFGQWISATYLDFVAGP
jgi:leader peptidase (prepilin peptidase)/N-methyltransferase